MANPHLTATGQPWWPSTYSSPIPAQPVATGTPNFGGQGTGGDNQPPIVDTPVVNTTPDPVANVSTGMGADDLKVQHKQKQAAEEKQKYIDKLKGYAASMSSSPGLYGDLYGPGGTGLTHSFDAANDPTINQDLYNVDAFSGEVPVSDFQKLKFLSDYGLGSGLGSFMATDDWGDPIMSGGYEDEYGNWIPENITYTGLGNTMLDQWGEAFDPGGIRYGDDPLITGGSAIRDYLGDVEDDYWKSFDQGWYGMDDFDYGFYGGRPETASMTDPNWWQQTALSDIDPTGFADFQHMYGKEFGEERVASPHSWGIEPFSEMIVEGDY